jgi:hypothetical protein
MVTNGKPAFPLHTHSEQFITVPERKPRKISHASFHRPARVVATLVRNTYRQPRRLRVLKGSVEHDMATPRKVHWNQIYKLRTVTDICVLNDYCNASSVSRTLHKASTWNLFSHHNKCSLVSCLHTSSAAQTVQHWAIGLKLEKIRQSFRGAEPRRAVCEPRIELGTSKRGGIIFNTCWVL